MDRPIYVIDGINKTAEQDDFEQGCILSSGYSTYIAQSFYGNTPREAIEQFMDFVGLDPSSDEDCQSVLINACDETGRVDIQVHETPEGCRPDSEHLEEWKAGKERLWLCDYSGYLYQQAKTPVDLVRVPAIAGRYS
ncbi:hypothetical protein NB640_12485 [Oxalobacter vibrioformis]|uniref:Uncharacterized protein n=1 Tax=Oxalobacter vibrioformis TaxID=933080 RepID=A0A9E9LYL0_9BURK|nr:hypothetical protein [Oxalobacter vibrioformis]WAW10015.1 hypothetical protein NB640_12485 [Oxalobacter vibrioformis]